MCVYLEDTIIEKLEHHIKTSQINSSEFKNKSKNPLRNLYDVDTIWDYHKGYLEDEFEYSLFSLFCFYDYSIEDVFNLVHEISLKYTKNDLHMLVYTDFVEYFHNNHFHERKRSYVKSSKEYKNKINLKEEASSENIIHITEDYDSTVEIIGCLNQDMKDICNDVDISPEKRLELIGKYSKISIRLNEKRFGLLSKIREEIL